MINSEKSYRALIVGRKSLHEELSVILGGYGYFVEHCRTRLEGAKKFRSHKQSLVILDVETIQGFPERLFRFFRLVRENSIVLVAAESRTQTQVSRYLLWGAHDVLHLPLNRDALNFTLSRTSAYHRSMVRSTFLKNAFFFGMTMVPLWGILLYYVLH
jgi:DNA-binding response OmpR family regulator